MITYRIAKFWIRPAAFLIDVLLLVAIGFVLGQLFREYFISIKSNGILIGFLVCLLYFTICNSSICTGQTLGKFIFRIKVLDSKDNYLPVWKSFLRSLVMTIPYFFLNYQIPSLSASSIISIIFFDLLFFLLIGFAYFYIFNKATRQTIHDFVVSSFVVSCKKETEEFERQPVKPLIYYLYISISMVLIIVFVIFSPTRIYTNKFSGEKNISSKLNQIENITKCTLSMSLAKSFDFKSSQTYRILRCDLYVTKEIDENPESHENNALIKEAMTIILENYSELSTLNNITVRINRGYDIGIFWSNKKVEMAKTPDEWMKYWQERNDFD